MGSPAQNLLIFLVLVLIIIAIWNSKNILRRFKSRAFKKKTIVEDVLKLLYHVEESNRNASFEALAGALRIRTSVLYDYVEEMSSEGLIRVNNDALQLTDNGRVYAIQIIRVHRLWEKYLSEKTGIDKSEWHDLAEKKEHDLSEEEIEQLYEQLGRPRFDPHGDPIPTESGELIALHGTPLPNLSNGTTAKIIHLEDEPKVVYDQILDHHLHMGSQVQLISSDDKAVRFYCEGDEYTLSPIVASNIGVRELSTTEIFEEGNIRLSALEEGDSGTIVGISSDCRGANRRRLLDLGFVKGADIKLEYNGPMENPKAYLIKNTLIALRKDQSNLVLITKNEGNGSR
jgi:DtxR family Mn-dependent transcriptional regulator